MLKRAVPSSVALVLLSLTLATPLSLLAAPLSSSASDSNTNASHFQPDPDCLSCGLSRASEALSRSLGTVVEGSLTSVGASAMVIVSSVEVLAEGSVVIVRGVANGVSVSIQLSGQALQGVAMVSGTIIQVSTVATGHMLISAGKVIAFIPNELGKALLHHEKV